MEFYNFVPFSMRSIWVKHVFVSISRENSSPPLSCIRLSSRLMRISAEFRSSDPASAAAPVSPTSVSSRMRVCSLGLGAAPSTWESVTAPVIEQISLMKRDHIVNSVRDQMGCFTEPLSPMWLPCTFKYVKEGILPIHSDSTVVFSICEVESVRRMSWSICRLYLTDRK